MAHQLWFNSSCIRFIDTASLLNILFLNIGETEVYTLRTKGLTNLTELHMFSTFVTFLNASDLPALQILDFSYSKVRAVNLSKQKDMIVVWLD